MNNNSPNGISAVDEAILNKAVLMGNSLDYVKNTVSNNAGVINWFILIVLFMFVIFM